MQLSLLLHKSVLIYNLTLVSCIHFPFSDQDEIPIIFLDNKTAFIYQHLALSSFLMSKPALFYSFFFFSFASSQKLNHPNWVNIFSQLRVHQSPQRQSPVGTAKSSVELPSGTKTKLGCFSPGSLLWYCLLVGLWTSFQF